VIEIAGDRFFQAVEYGGSCTHAQAFGISHYNRHAFR